jgi:hypothetical protein
MLNWAQFFPSEDGKLGEFLNRSGRPINCRLDFRLTRLEELKKAAVVISELNAQLQRLAYEVDGDPVLRVMLARGFFSTAQIDLKYCNPASVLARKKKAAAAEILAKKALKAKKSKPVIDLGIVVSEVAKVLEIAPLVMRPGWSK